MANKELDLFKELIPSIDMGFKELYDAAGEDGKKDIKLDLWNLNRYWNVLGGTNHVKLQWQLLCVAGKTGKKQFHPWIGLKKKKDDSSKAVNLLAQIYPEMKMDEVETLARISTKKEIKELAKEHGYEKVDI